MTGHLRLGVSVLVVSLQAVLPAASAANLRVLAREARPTSVSGYGDVVAWSSFHHTTRRYALTIAVRGRIHAAPVAERAVPFDVDVGPGPDGDPTVVYSRCRREPDSRSHADLPVYGVGRGCEIYSYDIGARREHKVAVGVSREFSQYQPSIWRGRIAYVARRWPLGHPRVFLSDRRAAPRQLKGGPLGETTGPSPGGHVFPETFGPGPLQLDLVGTRVAVVWERRGSTCPFRAGESDVTLTDARILRHRRASRRLAMQECTESGTSWDAVVAVAWRAAGRSLIGAAVDHAGRDDGPAWEVRRLEVLGAGSDTLVTGQGRIFGAVSLDRGLVIARTNQATRPIADVEIVYVPSDS